MLFFLFGHAGAGCEAQSGQPLGPRELERRMGTTAGRAGSFTRWFWNLQGTHPGASFGQASCGGDATGPRRAPWEQVVLLRANRVLTDLLSVAPCCPL